MTTITLAIKDIVLFHLRDNYPLEQLVYVTTKELLIHTETDFDTFRAVLRQFERFGFLEELGVEYENTCFILLADLHDFAYKGGFFVQEELFKGNIEKLGFEIDHLRKQLGPDHLDTMNKISSIASAIFSGLALLPK
jgi:hypothetical protein